MDGDLLYCQLPQSSIVDIPEGVVKGTKVLAVGAEQTPPIGSNVVQEASLQAWPLGDHPVHTQA